MNLKKIAPLFGMCLLSACAHGPIEESVGSADWKLIPDCMYFSGMDKGTEIVSVQQSSLRAVLSNFNAGSADILDLSQAGKISRLQRFSLGLNKGEELTSVAFHPTLDVFAAVIDAGEERGRLEIRSAGNGNLLDHVEVGYGPDSVVFSNDGSLLLVANEGEEFSFDRQTGEFFSAEGSISIVHLDNKGHIKANANIEMADVSHREGFIVAAKGHFLERAIDWDGDGKISKKIDFDRNGKIDNKHVKLGRFEGHDVYGNEFKGEAKILIPLVADAKTLLEPEYIALSPDAKRAYVTLQETDEVAEVDIENAKVLGYFDLGIAEHEADRRSDGWVEFVHSVTALREPDGIALTPDGRYFVTADEGDTDIDDQSGEEPVQSGGRSVSVFDAATGDFVADTGNQLDEITFVHGVYPDRRSNKKGAEPEGIISFEMEGQPWAVVGMERADALVLISLANPKQPKVVALGKIPGDEARSPEGLAHFERDGEHYVLSANEMNGTLACFKVTQDQIELEH
ncbi:choice-of-anchor I domain-containing protein [Methylomonas sp. MgM2]